MTASTQNASHIEIIDHARGVAIVAVLLCHTVSCVYGYDFIPWDGLFRNFFDSPFSSCLLFPLSCGGAGVALFFVISGFCIHLSFQQQQLGWGTFFLRRFFRIYPAYLAALIFFVLLNCIGHFRSAFNSSEGMFHFFTHLFLVHNCSLATFKTINGSFWSLAVEVQLYLLYPLFLGIVSKFGWRTSLAILAVLELAVQGASGFLEGEAASASIVGRIPAFLAMSPLGYWFSWALGALLGEVFMKRQLPPLSTVSPLWWIVLAISTFLVRPMHPFWFTASAIASAVLLNKLLDGAARENNAKFKTLKNLGIWSYSIYLLHQPLQFIYLYAIDWLVPISSRSAPIEVVLAFSTWLVIVPVAFLWYKCFEIPGIAASKRIIRASGFHVSQAGQVLNLGSRPRHPMILARYTTTFAILGALVVGTFIAKNDFSPKNPVESNNLAWSLATDHNVKSRNGTLAVIHAEDACEQTDYKVTVMVGTLAAAYAEAGRFDEAISTAQKACLMADQSGDKNLLQRNQELLSLYENHKPYHQ